VFDYHKMYLHHRVPAVYGQVRAGDAASARWQVTLRDQIWQAGSRSGEVLLAQTVIPYLYIYICMYACVLDHTQANWDDARATDDSPAHNSLANIGANGQIMMISSASDRSYWLLTPTASRGTLYSHMQKQQTVKHNSEQVTRKVWSSPTI